MSLQAIDTDLPGHTDLGQPISAHAYIDQVVDDPAIAESLKTLLDNEIRRAELKGQDDAIGWAKEIINETRS